MQAFSAQGPLSMSVERILSPGDQGLSKSVRLQEPSASQSRCKGLGEKVLRMVTVPRLTTQASVTCGRQDCEVVRALGDEN